MTLDQVPVRRRATVSTLAMPAPEQHRLTELGMRHGVEVEVLRRAPFGGPLAVRLPGGSLLALRRAQAALIVVGDGDHPVDGDVGVGDGARADV